MKTQAFRDLCLSLPGAREKITWGHPTFRIANKIFAAHGPDGVSAGIGTDLAEQAELLGLDPATYRVADFTGRYGWVDVRLASAEESTGACVGEAFSRGGAAPSGIAPEPAVTCRITLASLPARHRTAQARFSVPVSTQITPWP